MAVRYERLKAPVYYVDDVPAYKAGEWPGIKSNKFENTRAIIHPSCQGIVFNGNNKSQINNIIKNNKIFI